MPKPTKKKQKRTDQTRLDKPVAGIANEKSFMRDLIFLVALSLGLLFFFKDAISGMRTLIWDAADAFYPYLFSVSTAYRNMEIPLWNPFFFNGYPLFANIQAQTFYPLNFLFFPFTSFTPYVVQLSLILHFLLAGVFMYLLGRNYFENRWACALSATVYMLSGFMVGHMEHLTIIESMAWFPLVFLLFEKALAQKNLFFSLLAGFFFGISILAGHPQTCHIMYFILFIHALYRIATQFIKEKTHAALLKSGLVLLVFSIAGLLISAVQVVPTLELAKASTRAGALPFEFAARSGQLSLNDLSILILPNYFGAVTGPYWGGIDISQNLLYTGIVPLFLAGFVLINVKKNYDIIYFFLMMIFSLLLALGEHGLIFRLLYNYIPGFDHFRAPANTVFIYTFFAALLAGYGVNVLSAGFKNWTFYIYCVLFLCLSFILYNLGPVPPKEIGVAAKTAAIDHINNGFTFLVFLLSLSIVVFISFYRYPQYRKFYYFALLLLTFGDLYINLSDSITIGEKAAPGIYEQQPDLITAVRRDSGLDWSSSPGIELDDADVRQGIFRIFTEPRGFQGTAPLGYQRGTLHRIFMVEGYDPLEMVRHSKLGDTLIAGNFDNYLKINNVKYISKLDGSNVYLNKYPNFLPRAYTVANATFMDNDDQVLQKLRVFDPLSEVVISGKGNDVTGQSLSTNDSKATITKYSDNEVKIQTHSEKGGFLILSDTYYPGWHALVDEVESPVLRANYDFRAVFLPKGDHIVDFKFKPSSFKIGLLITLFGLFSVGLAFFYTLYSKRKYKKIEHHKAE